MPFGEQSIEVSDADQVAIDRADKQIKKSASDLNLADNYNPKFKKSLMERTEGNLEMRMTAEHYLDPKEIKHDD